MRKRTVSSSENKTNHNKKVDSDFNVKTFLGVAIAGGKTNKTALACIDLYPKEEKIFLSHLHTNIKSDGKESADLKLCDLVTNEFSKVQKIAFDVPLTLPKCLRCKLSCPGYESCTEEEIIWLWSEYTQLNKQRKPKRLFTPYTERCVEHYIANSLEEKFHPSHALGANLAPLVARGLFLKRRLKMKLLKLTRS